MVFIVRAGVSTVHQHVTVVVQQVLAVVSHIDHHCRPPGLFHLLQHAVEEEIHKSDRVVVRVDKYRFQVAICHHVLCLRVPPYQSVRLVVNIYIVRQ